MQEKFHPVSGQNYTVDESTRFGRSEIEKLRFWTTKRNLAWSAVYAFGFEIAPYTEIAGFWTNFGTSRVFLEVLHVG